MKKLTPKQERFVQVLVTGTSQREAYRAAYDCAKSSDRTVDNKASKLYLRDDIRARYDELVAEAAAKAVYTRQQMIADLTEIRDIGFAHIRRTKAHKENFDANGKRELAELPRGTAAVLSAIDRLDKLLRLSDSGDGDGRVVIVDDI